MQPISEALRRLEELGLNSSAPPAQLLYDGWLLRLLPGQAKRARCVNAVYPSVLPLAEKVAYCERVYRSRGLPVIFRITPFSSPATLDADLDRLGYPKFDLTSVESTLVQAHMTMPSGVESSPLAGWTAEVGRLRRSPAAHAAAHLARLQGSPLALCPLVVRSGGTVVATGLTMVEDGWAGLFDIVTDDAARRQGHGQRIVQGLLAAAWEMGARQAYLQVGSDNMPARSLYRQYGFEPRYEYWYRGDSERTS